MKLEKPAPKSSSTPTRADGPSSFVRAARTRRVLIVEDDIDSAEVMTEFLQLAGHEVRTAHDARAAISAAVEFKPHVVLVDLGLEHSDGFELLAALKAMPALPECDLIACTGYVDDAMRKRCLDSGFKGYLPKPTDMDLLLQLVAGDASDALR